MEFQNGFAGIVAVCAAVLLIGAIRKKSEGLMNFVLRMVLGTVVIYFANQGVGMLGLEGGVGINAATVLTSGILGFPGVAALFGIFFYRAL